MSWVPGLTVSTKKAFVLGVGAGAVVLLLSYLLRMAAIGFFLPELAAQTLFSLTPGRIESTVVANLGSLAKYTVFVAAITINLLLYGVIAALILMPYRLFRRWGRGVAALLLSLTSYLLFFLLGELLLATTSILSQPVSPGLLAVYLLPPQFLFGILVAFAEPRFSQKPSAFCEPLAALQTFDSKRRLVVKAGVATAVAAVLLYYGVDLLFPRSREGVPFARSPAVDSLLSQEITPNDRFYRVDGNIIEPDVNKSDWRLYVHGLVNSPLQLTFDDIQSMPQAEQYNTLQCVSNKIGDVFVSTAKWKGVRLREVLARAGVRTEAVYIVFRCVDNYDVGIPLERGLLDGALLVHEMNGEPLPAGHGSPLRAIIPGLYGMMNAKWVKEIELVDKVYEGFWQRLGWTNMATYETVSSIVVPGDPVKWIPTFLLDESVVLPLGQSSPLAGLAFSGDRGISRVEVSTDGGATWTPASVKDPLSDYTWVLWSATWNPPHEGEYELTVRATDRAGNVQTAEFRDPFPGGATGYHIVDVTVKSVQSKQ